MPRNSQGHERRQAKRDADAAFAAISDLPGTHLQLRPGIFRATVRHYDSILASSGRLFLASSGNPFKYVVRIGDQELERSKFSDLEPALLDRATGERVLWKTGEHYHHKASSVVHLSGSRSIRFPVSVGTSSNNSVMHGVDETGRTILWFRRSYGAGAVSPGHQDVVVAPGQPLTTELLAAIVVASTFLGDFYQPSGG